MRLKITLKSSSRKLIIPINYQYPLASAIYKILKNSEPKFAQFLHQKGYTTAHQRTFKFFTFSKLFFYQPPKVVSNTLILNHNEKPQLLISSYHDDEFIKNFIIGLFESQEFPIGLKNVCHTTFYVEFVEALPEPELKGILTCKSISPICVSIKSDNTAPNYLRALDPRVPDAIKNNLLWKYRTIFNREPTMELIQNLKFNVDTTYVNKRGGDNKVSKLITIKENQEDETKIKSFVAPFQLSGSEEILQIAYRCGIGEKNSLGFGMFEIGKSVI